MRVACLLAHTHSRHVSRRIHSPSGFYSRMSRCSYEKNLERVRVMLLQGTLYFLVERCVEKSSQYSESHILYCLWKSSAPLPLPYGLPTRLVTHSVSWTNR